MLGKNKEQQSKARTAERQLECETGMTIEDGGSWRAGDGAKLRLKKLTENGKQTKVRIVFYTDLN